VPPLNLSDLEKKFEEAVQRASSLTDLDSIRRDFLGKQGSLNSLFKNLAGLSPEDKQAAGKSINDLKIKIEETLKARTSATERAALEEKFKTEKEDLSLPSFPFQAQTPHPLTRVLREVCEIFVGLGFRIAEGPEIETDQNNFGDLNIPEEHPSRDMHDTFYMRPLGSAAPLLLRTHTSPVQIRTMKKYAPPIRIIAPGKVFRHEAVDATHSSVFHQIEGLAVDEKTSFADLKGTLELFSREFFGNDVKIRLRPSFFPFVEPGAEVDITCTICKSGVLDGKTCPVCKGTRWIEMLGAGMVHPNVFKAMGYDPEKVTGYAFGMGIERIAMIRYGIKDMRLFYENHLDFLRQF
jgi:phenylalanyl-tRNA synthetase alpha chain